MFTQIAKYVYSISKICVLNVYFLSSSHEDGISKLYCDNFNKQAQCGTLQIAIRQSTSLSINRK